MPRRTQFIKPIGVALSGGQKQRWVAIAGALVETCQVGEGTADNWVERNPAMVRLTGKHLFNAEAPLTRLMHHGFITPVSLHYVRNHGYVPKARWDEWSVEITRLVKCPMKLTMHQLVDEFPSRDLCRKSQKRAKYGETDHRFQLGYSRNIHLRLAGGAVARHSEAVRYLQPEKGWSKSNQKNSFKKS
ncbi:Nitrate reductase [nadh] 2 [Forsythia ovata]|uniref:Nitrate reductase [nadh] 2 n=1 Tax=Forsythia ovata TaxID=205694 RepID=A0ABD1W5D9_9LAMI